MITLRDGIVGAFALIAFSALSISVAAYLGDVEAGDILGFEGAMVGAAGAVWGALYVEGRKRRLAALEEQRPILDALAAMDQELRRFKTCERMDRDIYDMILRASRTLDKIYGFFPPKTPQIIFAREQYRNAEEMFFSAVVNHQTTMILYPDHPVPESVTIELNALLFQLLQLKIVHAKTS
ncbi:hypothetical protein [Sphingomonas sp.]|uniref:hypothetical protein n=1 Tax=Sphingomonas sp. TaxID=28214 RepID=UPI0031D0F771